MDIKKRLLFFFLIVGILLFIAGCSGGPYYPPIEPCTDTDGGVNYDVKGVVYVNDESYTDYCGNEINLTGQEGDRMFEYFCHLDVDGNYIQATETGYICPNGCSNGACIKITPIIVRDGDPFPGGDGTCSDNNPDDPDCWVFDIGGVRTTTTTTIPFSSSSTTLSGVWIAIENDFVINDDTDNPPKPGQCINLPNNYISICYDSNTVAGAYGIYTIEHESDTDFSQAGGAYSTQTTEPSIYIHTTVDKGLEIGSALFAREIWLSVDNLNNNLINVFYKDPVDNKVKHLKDINRGSLNDIASVNYSETNGQNIVIRGKGTSTEDYKIEFDIIGDSVMELGNSTDGIETIWKITNDFKSLGQTPSTAESNELVFYGTGSASGYPINIGTKDEHHRTPYGIIINDPLFNGALDKVELSITEDQVQANVVVKSSNPSATQVKEDIPLGQGIAENSAIGFDNALEDDDISSLLDTRINFIGLNYYNIREVILFWNESPSIETSLTSGDDDYQHGIFMEVDRRDSIKYVYAFDTPININTASPEQPLTIDFLGETIQIIGTESDTSLIIIPCSTGACITPPPSTQLTVLDGDSVGNLAVTDETCMDNNPDDLDCWVWNLEGLMTSNARIGIENDFVINDDTDNPIMNAGEYYSLPNKYISIGFAGINPLDSADVEIIGAINDGPITVNAGNSLVGGGFNSQYIDSSNQNYDGNSYDSYLRLPSAISPSVENAATSDIDYGENIVMEVQRRDSIKYELDFSAPIVVGSKIKVLGRELKIVSIESDNKLILER